MTISPQQQTRAAHRRLVRRAIWALFASALALGTLAQSAHPVGQRSAELAVAEPQVELVSGWLERQQRNSAQRWTQSDARQLHKKLSRDFAEAFYAALEERIEFRRVSDDWKSTDFSAQSASAVAVRIHVFELDPRSPQHPRNTRTTRFSSTELSAAVRMEFVDPASGSVLHTFSDRRREGAPDAALERRQQTSDQQAMRRLAIRWAGDLVDQLAKLPPS